MTSTTMYAAWAAAGLDCRAALGIEEVRYEAPPHAGDTVRVEIEVIALRPTRSGSAWYREVCDVLLDQDGTPVLRMRRSYLLIPLEDA